MLANSDGIATYCINSYLLYTRLYKVCEDKKRGVVTPLVYFWRRRISP